MFEMVTEHFANPNLSVVVAKCCFLGFVVRDRTFMCTVFITTLSLDLDDLIFYCLLASMAAVQAEDVRASFLFVGDLNGHYQEWLGSTTTVGLFIVYFMFLPKYLYNKYSLLKYICSH